MKTAPKTYRLNIPYEEKVLARLDTIDGRLTNIESRLDGVKSRLQNLEAKQYDTKPIWERALAEIAETRAEMNARFESFESTITILAGDVVKVLANAADLLERILARARNQSKEESGSEEMRT